MNVALARLYLAGRRVRCAADQGNGVRPPKRRAFGCRSLPPPLAESEPPDHISRPVSLQAARQCPHGFQHGWRARQEYHLYSKPEFRHCAPVGKATWEIAHLPEPWASVPTFPAVEDKVGKKQGAARECPLVVSLFQKQGNDGPCGIDPTRVSGSGTVVVRQLRLRRGNLTAVALFFEVHPFAP